MSNVKFLLVLPTNQEGSDKVHKFVIQGTLLQNPKQFSINFVNSPSCTDNITYHFKVNVDTQTIVENYKSDGEWSGSHQEKYLNIFNDSEFSLEFELDYDNSVIYVHQVHEEGHNFVSKFETLFALTAIKSIQVWGDVRKINNYTLGYH